MVRGVGGVTDFLIPLFPGGIGSTVGYNVGQAVVNAPPEQPGVPRPTFMSALGTETGKTIRILLLWGIAGGVAWYLLRPKLQRFL